MTEPDADDQTALPDSAHAALSLADAALGAAGHEMNDPVETKPPRKFWNCTKRDTFHSDQAVALLGGLGPARSVCARLRTRCSGPRNLIVAQHTCGRVQPGVGHSVQGRPLLDLAAGFFLVHCSGVKGLQHGDEPVRGLEALECAQCQAVLRGWAQRVPS